ncbi:MAG: PepSY-associated TM helix domain-containing protein [Moraxellaceae bacterium]|nr:PepSY-associated TM helix domain-containing protein [Moraxellaceae bacterium]
MSPAALTPEQQHRNKRRRALWMKQLHQWHWISSALCLIGMLLFAVTGITLNHAASIEATPTVQRQVAVLPPSLLTALADAPEDGSAPLPAALQAWLEDGALQVAVGDRPAEWSADEMYLALPRPGGDAWLSIDRQNGAVEYEVTRRGLVSYLNDLHKGRNTGTAWSWFIDGFAIATLVFCLSGLLLLQLHAGHRRMTWPVVGMGLLAPLLLVLLFIH